MKLIIIVYGKNNITLLSPSFLPKAAFVWEIYQTKLRKERSGHPP